MTDMKVRPEPPATPEAAPLRIAGHIIVLDGGQVVQEGTHEELMARGGLYAEMFSVQAERYR